MADLAELWTVIEAELGTVCMACNDGKLLPIVEADVVGYFYYALLTKLKGDAQYVHLGARLLGGSEKEKYDIVIGQCVGTAQLKQAILQAAGDALSDDLRKSLVSRSTRSGFRPQIRADVVLELKMFGEELGPPGGHLSGVFKDLRKLAALATACEKGRGVVLFDDKQYLDGARRQQLVSARDAEAESVRIYVLGRSNGDITWRLL